MANKSRRSNKQTVTSTYTSSGKTLLGNKYTKRKVSNRDDLLNYKLKKAEISTGTPDVQIARTRERGKSVRGAAYATSAATISDNINPDVTVYQSLADGGIGAGTDTSTNETSGSTYVPNINY